MNEVWYGGHETRRKCYDQEGMLSFHDYEKKVKTMISQEPATGKCDAALVIREPFNNSVTVDL